MSFEKKEYEKEDLGDDLLEVMKTYAADPCEENYRELVTFSLFIIALWAAYSDPFLRKSTKDAEPDGLSQFDFAKDMWVLDDILKRFRESE